MIKIKKEKILKDFTEILSNNGIENTSTRQLLACAGIGTSIAYNEWDSKENMVIAAGKYITEVISKDIRSELYEYANDITTLGEYYYSVIKKHRTAMRFCIQLMTSPNPQYSSIHNHIQQALHNWSDELADMLEFDRKSFYGLYVLFMSSLYYYCISENEDTARCQRFALYENFKNLPKVKNILG